MANPFLSIGIIFKNEIRCLERCLKSLAPLREALHCELVMADTGSDDGSREVAEKYADILFDFPWINDFAAARNAVMDRCTGRWYLSLDADEWLDGDTAELISFIRSNNRKELESCRLRIRNYLSKNSMEQYSDFYATRLLRMSSGIRFHGAIHERWEYDDGRPIYVDHLTKTLLHHDGYMGLNTPEGEAKRKRNKALLAERLAGEPENLRFLLQYIESSRPDDDHMDYIHRGLAAVEEKKPDWEIFGPVIYRYAVFSALGEKLPEAEAWIARMEELFPDSFYTTIDIGFQICLRFWDKKNYERCIFYGERYLKAVADCEAGRGDQTALLVSTLVSAAPRWVRKIRQLVAASYEESGQPARALEMLEAIEPLDGSLVGGALKNLQELQVSTDQDTALFLLRLYERITSEPDAARAQELMTAFSKTAPLAFGPDVREKEAAREDFHRHGYTVYLPLAGRCETGTAAAAMEAGSVQEIDRLLGMVKKWGDFPVSALIGVLEKGAAFPPAGQRMSIEEMDHTARRLAQYQGRFFNMASQRAPQMCGGSWQQLTWARSMIFAAVQAFGWAEEKQGLALAEAFSKVMETFVSRCYTDEVLCEENIQILPPVHRFGWYISRAFQTLEAGDTVGYARLLRSSLEACPEMKIMVEFLSKHTPQLKPAVPGELLALAEQVRTLLSACAPDDPAVVMLKRSAAYQKVAHLIEGPEPGVFGGLAQ